MNLFLELPLELQEKILSYIPKDLAAISQANSELYMLVNKCYIDILGSQPISEKEYLAYTKNYPLIVGNHVRIREGDLIHLETELYIRRLTDTYNIIRITTTFNGENKTHFYYEHNMINQSSVKIYVEGMDCDLITLQRILQGRIGCVRRDPMYVKKYMKRYMKTRFSNITTKNQVDLYLYLWLNAYALNLNYVPKNLFLPRIYNIESELINEITILSNLVYEWIDKL